MTNQNQEAQAYQSLKEKILNAKLIPGDILSETSLSQTLGMSRTPVRYALKQLEYEGFIVYHKNRGISIRETPAREMVEILEITIQFQLAALEKVKNGESTFDIKKLTALADEAQTLRDNKNYADYIDRTQKINTCLISSSGNGQMVKLYDTLWARIISTSVYNKMSHPEFVPVKKQTTIGFMKDLISALSIPDYKEAKTLLDAYFNYARDQILYYGQI